MKVLLLEVSHWHFPLYIEALRVSGIKIVGVSERDPEIRARYAAMFDCESDPDWRELLARCAGRDRIDAAFAFGLHAEMPEIGRALIGRRIPFAIEKPAGQSITDVTALQRAAAAAGVPVAVPLVQRAGPLLELFNRLTETEGACFATQSWRFNAGPPGRYIEAGCGWMLDPAISGGGCLINLAVHFVDLALSLMPHPPDSVTAHVGSAIHNVPVEDSAMLVLTAQDGSRAIIESGYNFPESPDKRDYNFALAGSAHYVLSKTAGVSIVRSGQSEEFVPMSLDSDPLYGIFAERFLADIAAGRLPSPGLDRLVSAVQVIDAAYLAATTGQTIPLTPLAS